MSKYCYTYLVTPVISRSISNLHGLYTAFFETDSVLSGSLPVIVIDGILGAAHNYAIDHEIISVTPHDNGIITQVPQQLYYYTNTVLPARRET